jgi:hypothetical protein
MGHPESESRSVNALGMATYEWVNTESRFGAFALWDYLPISIS